MFPGLPQLSEMPLVQNLGINGGAENDYSTERKFMLKKIWEVLRKCNQRPQEVPPEKLFDIVKRIEATLFKNATSMEEYLDLKTLVSRLNASKVAQKSSDHSHHFSQFNSSPAIATMIPTPGLQETANLSLAVTTSMDGSFPAINSSSVVKSEIFMANGNGSHTGSLAGRFQYSFSASPVYSGSRNIPAYGFSNSTYEVSNAQSLVESEPLNNVGWFSAFDSSTASQNGRPSHSINGCMGGGIRSAFQQKSYGLSNGPLNGGLGMMGNDIPTMSCPEANEAYFSGVNSSRLVQQQSNRKRRALFHGNGNGIVAADISEMYVPGISSSMYMQSMERANTPLMTSHCSNLSSSVRQTHDQMEQRLHQQQSVVKQESDLGIQDVMAREYNQKPKGQIEARPSSLCTEEPIVVETNGSNAFSQHRSVERECQYRNQQRWLLFLWHARRCPYSEGKCREPRCFSVQGLLKHMEGCKSPECPQLRCRQTRILIDHHRKCHSINCPVCIPVKNHLRRQVKRVFRSDAATELFVSAEAIEDLRPAKRMKVEESPRSVFGKCETSVPLIYTTNEPPRLADQHSAESDDSHHIATKAKVAEVKLENPEYVEQMMSDGVEKMEDCLGKADARVTENSRSVSDVVAEDSVRSEKEMAVRTNTEKASEPHEAGSKSEKPKVTGVSLTELFTPEQIRQHLTSLRQWVGQRKAKAEKNQARENFLSENSCQLCAAENLTFEPPPIYCAPCGARIKKNGGYHTVGDARHYVCTRCWSEARGNTISVDKIAIPKAKMTKIKSVAETNEPWVQCDKCEVWQHQICALFNSRRNEGGQAEYTCPKCYLKEIERGERLPLPQSAVLGAKDLPRSILSDHVEQRLFAKLKHERQERARIQGKRYEEVPGAESLVVRVVSSVDKNLEVKPRFLESLQAENYPREFPYKSKVILLFQNIEGVEVCIFGMYVQEYGSECEQPNHRRVYLSYLDSVKYFRPDVKTANGEALRTFVYHEILIGYLEYCKMRGFTSCYIWACPPLKGEDYILYCHPEIQRTPKSDKLREWYLSMLRKASTENIVVKLTNLHDDFFVSTGECKAKVTAARLPYFDGDYWPGAAEDMIDKMEQEGDESRRNKGVATSKRSIAKRAFKSSGQIDLSGNVTKDMLLMHRLGQTILPMKEDFIMVHLQHQCAHCCVLIVSGNRWVCRQCKDFQLCDKCYDAERKREGGEKHPIHQKEKHKLFPIEIDDVPEDTRDKDEVIESEFFDTRHSFLSLCQGNHYQYDTLRRAKHSSMMVLYHLHNPTCPAFVTTCFVCRLDIEPGHGGWRCESCPEYDVCNECYLKDGGNGHPHKLTKNRSNEGQNGEARKLRVKQLRKVLDLLVHASACPSRLCQYTNCRKVKGLFRHGMSCDKRVVGDCVLCKRMWSLLQLHARACRESQCSVPRCRDLREHMRRSQQQSESRRRAAFNEMTTTRLSAASQLLPS